MHRIGRMLSRRNLQELLLISIWFLVIAWINQSQEHFVDSIFPYAIPVAVMVWRHGVALGFLLAALATLAAAPAHYIAAHTPSETLWAAFVTYFKLSCVVLGTEWCKTSGAKAD